MKFWSRYWRGGVVKPAPFQNKEGTVTLKQNGRIASQGAFNAVKRRFVAPKSAVSVVYQKRSVVKRTIPSQSQCIPAPFFIGLHHGLGHWLRPLDCTTGLRRWIAPDYTTAPQPGLLSVVLPRVAVTVAPNGSERRA